MSKTFARSEDDAEEDDEKDDNEDGDDEDGDEDVFCRLFLGNVPNLFLFCNVISYSLSQCSTPTNTPQNPHTLDIKLRRIGHASLEVLPYRLCCTNVLP